MKHRTTRRPLHPAPVALGALACACTALCVLPAQAQTITDVGLLPSGIDAVAYGISADGSVAVGYDGTTAGFRAFRWSAPGTLLNLGLLPGASGFSRAFGVSADGSCVVGQASSPAAEYDAFRWTAALGMQDLGSGADLSTANGASADGAIIVGTAYPAGSPYAFRWTGATQRRELPAII